jgi:predicted Ser/Thr protein kinase
MHRRGVVHFDLSHRSNVLVGEDGRPVLIDFASALCLRPGGLAARVLLPLVTGLDRRALAKWRARLLPQPGAGADAAGASGSGRGASRPT